MKKLRLLVTKDCNRACPGCCNKDWDLDALEKCTSFKEYDEIILTGGEPMLYPKLLLETIKKIRLENKTCKIILYTANMCYVLSYIMTEINGITLTLHEQNDVENFHMFEIFFFNFMRQWTNKSLRLNIFKGITLNQNLLMNWTIKDNIEWMKDCPLPKDEVFMRI